MSDRSLEAAREAAKALGVKHHHNAGADTIYKAIEAYLERSQGLVDIEVNVDKPTETPRKIMPETREDIRQDEIAHLRRRAGQLRRVRITCMDPSKKDWQGEIISVGSSKLGTFKKYVPFQGQPYHIPQIIYDMLKERMCSVFYNVPAKDGSRDMLRKSKQVKAFAIEDLPPLTEAELEELARKQAMAANGL